MAYFMSTSTAAAPEIAPAYWRLLVHDVPGIALDRLAREIRSGRFITEGLRARARDLRTHLRADIRERARLELFPTLDMGNDGLEPSAHFD
jgi:hypothetical protein